MRVAHSARHLPLEDRLARWPTLTAGAYEYTVQSAREPMSLATVSHESFLYLPTTAITIQCVQQQQQQKQQMKLFAIDVINRL